MLERSGDDEQSSILELKMSRCNDEMCAKKKDVDAFINRLMVVPHVLAKSVGRPKVLEGFDILGLNASITDFLI